MADAKEEKSTQVRYIALWSVTMHSAVILDMLNFMSCTNVELGLIVTEHSSVKMIAGSALTSWDALFDLLMHLI
jgi:hypothetical protein